MITDYRLSVLEETDDTPLVAEDAKDRDIEILRPRHWLARRRLRLAKIMNDKEAKIRRYASIILRYAKGQEEIEFAQVAFQCLGKALGFVQEKKG